VRGLGQIFINVLEKTPELGVIEIPVQHGGVSSFVTFRQVCVFWDFQSPML